MDRPICRTCLAVTDETIFKTVFLAQKELSLVEMLNECIGGINVSETDKISLNICDICTDQIINYYVYRKKCLESHNFLLRRLEQSQINSIPLNNETVNTSEVACEITPLPLKSNDSVFTKKINNTDAVKCKLCNNIYSSSNLKLEHLRNVHNIVENEKFDCKHCKKCYRSFKSLRQHIIINHESEAPKFICHHCGQKFKTLIHLKLHIRRHTGEKPFKCDICEYRATQQTSVTVHMRTHTGERPYKCEDCGKLFRTSSSRASHRRSHSDETPYECLVCLKKFKKKDIYREHMIIHEPDKYVECKFCDKKFARKDNLNIHIKQHTGEKPHVCEYCGKRFIRKYCWQTHLKNHHNQ